MAEEWATCIECGWTGTVDNSITACPWCGYMVNMNIPLTDKEKRDLAYDYARAGYIASTQFMSRYSKWKR